MATMTPWFRTAGGTQCSINASHIEFIKPAADNDTVIITLVSRIEFTLKRSEFDRLARDADLFIEIPTQAGPVADTR
jgi:hypothetical protein